MITKHILCRNYVAVLIKYAYKFSNVSIAYVTLKTSAAAALQVQNEVRISICSGVRKVVHKFDDHGRTSSKSEEILKDKGLLIFRRIPTNITYAKNVIISLLYVCHISY